MSTLRSVHYVMLGNLEARKGADLTKVSLSMHEPPLAMVDPTDGNRAIITDAGKEAAAARRRLFGS